jgi:hypothetical protein
MHHISTIYDSGKTKKSISTASSSLHHTKTDHHHNKQQQQQHYVDDGRMKQNVAPPMIHEASRLFLDPVYDKMEHIRQHP